MLDPDELIIRIFDRRDTDKSWPGDHLDCGWIASQIQAYWGSPDAAYNPGSLEAYAKMVQTEIGNMLERPKMISVKPADSIVGSPMAGLAIEIMADDLNGRHFHYSFGVSLRAN